MPDQFGNPTPQEVMAKILAERNQDLNSAQTPNERRNANLAAIGRTLMIGGDPRLVRAQEISDALGKSLALQRNESESAIDFEIRRGRQMFEDVKSVDPTTAADVSQQLVKLEAERAQQNRLKAEDARDETRFGWETTDRDQVLKKQKNWDLTQGLFYEYDPKTHTVTGVTTSVDDPGHMVDVKEVRGRGNLLLNADDVNAAMLKTDAADYKLLGSDLAATKNQITGVIENVNVAKNVMQVLVDAGKKGENPMTYADKISRGLQPVVNGISESLKATGMKPAPAVGSPEFAEDVSVFEKELQRRGLQSQVPTSLLVQLAYTWAKSFDNRVTEQDFLNAYNMLGAGSGSPASIAATIREMTFGRYQSMMDTAGTVVSDLQRMNEGNKGSLGGKQSQALGDLLGVYKKRTDEFRDVSEQLLHMYDETDRHSPQAPPRADGGKLKVGNRTFNIANGGE